MGKEIKAGLAVIAMLIAVFVAVLAMRLRNPTKPTEVASVPKSEAKTEKPKLSSGPAYDASASPSSGSRISLNASNEDRWGSASRFPPPDSSSNDANRPTADASANYMPNPSPTSAETPPPAYTPGIGSATTDTDNRFAAVPPPAVPNEPAAASPPATPAPPIEGPRAALDMFSMPAPPSTLGNTPTPPAEPAAPEAASPLQRSPEVQLTPSPPLAEAPPPAAFRHGSSHHRDSQLATAPTEAAAPPLAAAPTQYPPAEPSPPTYPSATPRYMAAETPAYQPVQQTADTTPPANALPAAPYTPPAASPPTAAAPQYDIYGRDVAGETSPAGTLPPSTASRGASAAPQSPQTEQAYTIAPNDSFWTIAQAVYGSGGYFKALEAYNAPRFPNSSQLAVGATIALPPASVLEQKFPDLCPKPRQSPAARGTMLQASTRLTGGTQGRIYTVQRGDTLFDIARYELGKAARWSEIYELNRDRLGNDFDFLAPGMELILPNNATEPAARTTQAQPPFNR